MNFRPLFCGAGLKRGVTGLPSRWLLTVTGAHRGKMRGVSRCCNAGFLIRRGAGDALRSVIVFVRSLILPTRSSLRSTTLPFAGKMEGT